MHIFAQINMNIQIKSEKFRLKHDNQKSVIKLKKSFQKEKILNFRRKLHIITITQQEKTFTKEICNIRILIKIKKLANVVHDKSLNNRFIKFKVYVTIKRDIESESNHMLIDIAINEKRLRIIMNSSVSRNFITTRYTNYHELFIHEKTDNIALNDE